MASSSMACGFAKLDPVRDGGPGQTQSILVSDECKRGSGVTSNRDLHSLVGDGLGPPLADESSRDWIVVFNPQARVRRELGGVLQAEAPVVDGLGGLRPASAVTIWL